MKRGAGLVPALALAVSCWVVPAWSSAASAGAADAVHSHMPDGLNLCGSAQRNLLFIDVYRVQYFQGGCTAELPDALPESLVCAFLVEVLYGGDVPDSIPETWRDELLPVLSDRETRRLRQAYASLDQGDRVLVTRTASGGTRLAVNAQAWLETDDLALLQAFYSLMLLESPVARDLRASLADS